MTFITKSLLLCMQFNGPFSRTARVSQYQKGKISLDSTEARKRSDSVISCAMCKSAPRSRHITMPAPHYLVFLLAECPSCCPANSIKTLKANIIIINYL